MAVHSSSDWRNIGQGYMGWGAIAYSNSRMHYESSWRLLYQSEAEQAALNKCGCPDAEVRSAYRTYLALVLMNGQYFPAWAGGASLNELRNYVRTEYGSAAQIIFELDTINGPLASYTPAPAAPDPWERQYGAFAYSAEDERFGWSWGCADGESAATVACEVSGSQDAVPVVHLPNPRAARFIIARTGDTATPDFGGFRPNALLQKNGVTGLAVIPGFLETSKWGSFSTDPPAGAPYGFVWGGPTMSRMRDQLLQWWPSAKIQAEFDAEVWENSEASRIPGGRPTFGSGP
jgi:hypothetical protein